MKAHDIKAVAEKAASASTNDRQEGGLKAHSLEGSTVRKHLESNGLFGVIVLLMHMKPRY